jgi:hypothetical protein
MMGGRIINDWIEGMLNSRTMPTTRLLRTFLLIVCALSALALLIATIGAGLALITGHARWIELAWLSIAASLLAIVVSKLWPIVVDRAGSEHST